MEAFKKILRTPSAFVLFLVAVVSLIGVVIQSETQLEIAKIPIDATLTAETRLTQLANTGHLTQTATSTETVTPLPIAAANSTLTETLNKIPLPTETLWSGSPSVSKGFIAKVKTTSSCYNGPSTDYHQATLLSSGTNVFVLAKESHYGDWFMVEEENSRVRCWTEAIMLNYEFDPNLLIVYLVTFTRIESDCYTGPSSNFQVQTTIPVGSKIVINGKNNIDAEWVAVTPPDFTVPCWVESSSLTTVDFSSIPLMMRTPNPPTAILPSPTANGLAETPTVIPPTPTLCWPPGQCK